MGVLLLSQVVINTSSLDPTIVLFVCNEQEEAGEIGPLAYFHGLGVKGLLVLRGNCLEFSACYLLLPGENCYAARRQQDDVQCCLHARQ